MSAVKPEDLFILWTQEQISTEHAVGQILQQLVAMQSTIERQGQTITQLRTQIVDLASLSDSGSLTRSNPIRPKSKK